MDGDYHRAVTSKTTTRQRFTIPVLSRVLVVSLAVVVAGCMATPRNPAPAHIASAAIDQSLPIRFWGDSAPSDFAAIAQEIEIQRRAAGRNRRYANHLVLSGGGSDGAFGAGLLVGWSERGDRPRFDAVTGVSTGAIIAPFAFLGAQYNDEMEEVFTTLSSDDFFQIRLLPALTGGRLGIASAGPFKEIIARYADAQMLDEIGKEHRRGRRLFIGTTQLDAQRPVVWNIGALAVSDHPEKVALFREIIRASAAIPGVFEPVLLPIFSGGARYDELHVDGGVTMQMFLYPADLGARSYLTRGSRLYIIRNGKLAPQYAPVKASIPAIAGRSVSTLIKYQGIGDLFRLYTLARRDSLDFNLAYIPESFDVPSTEQFDLNYMQALFSLGRELGHAGYDWADAPPGFSK